MGSLDLPRLLLGPFFEAYWRQPEAYLDDHVRRAVSCGQSRAGGRAAGSLRDDLASGRWAECILDLASLDAAELGLRLLVA